MKKILFYEFSDLNREPIEFKRFPDFIKFCNDCNIVYNLDDVKIADEEDIIQAVCLKGTNVCIYNVNEKPIMDEEKEKTFREFLKCVKKHAVVYGRPHFGPQVIDIVTLDEKNRETVYEYWCGGEFMYQRNKWYYTAKKELQIEIKCFFFDLKEITPKEIYSDNKWIPYQEDVDDFRKRINIDC